MHEQDKQVLEHIRKLAVRAEREFAEEDDAVRAYVLTDALAYLRLSAAQLEVVEFTGRCQPASAEDLSHRTREFVRRGMDAARALWGDTANLEEA